MYIAFRWLFGLSSAMWVAMCCVDIYFNGINNIKATKGSPLYFYQNKTSNMKNTKIVKTLDFLQQKEPNFSSYHYVMFFTCSIILILFQKKQNITSLMWKFSELNAFSINFKGLRVKLYIKKYLHEFYNYGTTLNNMCVATQKNIAKIWKIVYETLATFANKLLKRRKLCSSNSSNIHNLILLNKFKELNEERKNLGKLLLTTIRENKNVRMRYQLEYLAKNRLARYIEDTEKVIKENRCQYVSFQQLYLATYQENLFLKSRIKKLTSERDNAEKNLIKLINEVCKSQNKELKAFCCRFIVDTKGNLLNCDVKSEIRKFLNTTKVTKLSTGESFKKLEYNKHITDIIDNKCLIISDAPKLRGLPGEYVWTVKDKDGVIEKLYEYNFQTDCDNGDTIRRIREYSVYFDKDCLLDYTSSRTYVDDIHDTPEKQLDFKVKHIRNYPITRQRFLTGSQAFQKFLRFTGNTLQCAFATAKRSGQF